MRYLLLLAGVFMGWSLGTNDAANAFGTAVATKVIRYRTAVIIIAIFVILGAFISGSNNLTSISELAVNNKVIASDDAIEVAVTDGTEGSLALKSAIKAAIILFCAGLTVFGMTCLKMSVSSNQSITGAIIGWGLFHADYTNPEVLAVNLPQILKFLSTWIINPVGAAVISFGIVFLSNKFLVPRLTKLAGYDKLIKIGYLAAGALASYSIGMNSSANVTALYFDHINDGVTTNLLTDARLAATIGGLAIALGVLTFSKRVMITVGSSIAQLSQIEGFLVIISMALWIVLIGAFIGIPVSVSQSVIGAIVGAGLVKSPKNVNFGVLKKLAISWVSSPLIAGILTYLAAWVTKGLLS
jgi:PiT family inorganic phosphate transporter